MEAKIERGAAPDVHRIEDASVNWYLVEADDGLTIVDTGVPRSWDSLQRVLGEIGRRASEIRALVLTHAHFDHIGFAERARRQLGVPVYLHENDVPLARKPLQYTHERPRSRYLLTKPKALPHVAGFLATRAFWPPPLREVKRFSEGELDVPGAPRVVFTPGHTLGHCALHFPDRDAAIVGDALVMLDPYTGAVGPRIVAGAATADSERALASLGELAQVKAGTLLSGHGEPWRGGAGEAVRRAREAGPS
jgi:glyoxylase-like metal-dependent hydrolase (beta-lactamase superfamily II)